MKGCVRLHNVEDIELTVTITMPVFAWKRARDREYWSPFNRMVTDALAKVDGLSTDTEIEP